MFWLEDFKLFIDFNNLIIFLSHVFINIGKSFLTFDLKNFLLLLLGSLI